MCVQTTHFYWGMRQIFEFFLLSLAKKRAVKQQQKKKKCRHRKQRRLDDFAFIIFNNNSCRNTRISRIIIIGAQNEFGREKPSLTDAAGFQRRRFDAPVDAD